MNDEISTLAAALRRQVTEKVDAIKNDPRLTEVITGLAALNAVEVLLQQPKTTLSGLFALDGGAEATSQSTMTPMRVAKDEFVNVAPLEAAKRYLKIVGRPPRSLDDIISAIKAGGGDVPNKSALRNQLNRSGEVKTVGDDFGLTDWYPKKRGRPVGSGGGNGDGEDDDAGAGAATPADLTAPGEDDPEGGDE